MCLVQFDRAMLGRVKHFGFSCVGSSLVRFWLVTLGSLWLALLSLVELGYVKLGQAILV